MKEIQYIYRETQQKCSEKVYGHFFLKLLYGPNLLARAISYLVLPCIAGISFFSKLYGSMQRNSSSRSKVARFIKNFNIDTHEFLEEAQTFKSFNDFFIRKLKLESRPIVQDKQVVTLPADARYLVYQNIEDTPGFWVKGHKFCLEALLADPSLAQKYAKGSMVIARLAPVDYHRFHFPVDCVPSAAQTIPGPLYSVNPIALKRDIHILSRNKRMITKLETESFGTILFVEIGATYVGTIHQTYKPNLSVKKGEEKGFFSFGGSCLILLFEPGKIVFDQDLLDASSQQIEVLGKMGQSLGKNL